MHFWHVYVQWHFCFINLSVNEHTYINFSAWLKPTNIFFLLKKVKISNRLLKNRSLECCQITSPLVSATYVSIIFKFTLNYLERTLYQRIIDVYIQCIYFYHLNMKKFTYYSFKKCSDALSKTTLTASKWKGFFCKTKFHTVMSATRYLVLRLKR